MSHDINRDRKPEKDTSYEVADLEFRDIHLPKTCNILYSILSSLNHNIANFYAYTKFKDISEKGLELELLQRSMNIHRDFSVLFLHTREELVLTYPDLLKKVEKLLFKGSTSTNFISYTCKLCKLINDYQKLLCREGYLPDPRIELSFNDT